MQRAAKVPHQRHWAALAELAEEGQEEAERQHGLEERFKDVDFKEEILPHLDEFTLRELSEKTGLSPSYLGEIRRGEKVPSIKHWSTFLFLPD